MVDEVDVGIDVGDEVCGDVFGVGVVVVLFVCYVVVV